MACEGFKKCLNAQQRTSIDSEDLQIVKKALDHAKFVDASEYQAARRSKDQRSGLHFGESVGTFPQDQCFQEPSALTQGLCSPAGDHHAPMAKHQLT
jgi:hypothetical protein